MENKLSNQIYIVTGATSGIGRAIAEQLAKMGAGVIGIGRSEERCRKVEREMRSQFIDTSIVFLTCDLSLQSEVRRAADDIQRVLADLNRTSLDGLVNNAGAFTYWLTLTAEGFETQWAVNHLAPFLLTHQLLPLLHAAPSARVVTVSSASHYGARIRWEDIQLRRRYNGLRAYEQTKLANVLFSAEFNRRLGSQSNVRAYAADPGLVKTDIGMKGTPAIVRWIWSLRRSGGISADESASGIVYLLTAKEVEQTPDQVYWKHGHPKAPSKYSLDPDISRRLWDISENMCGISTTI